MRCIFLYLALIAFAFLVAAVVSVVLDRPFRPYDLIALMGLAFAIGWEKRP